MATSAPSAPVPPKRPALRILRWTALAFLAAIAALLLAVAALAASVSLREGLAGVLGLPFHKDPFSELGEWTVAVILIGPVVLVAAGILVLAWVLRITSWRAVAAASAVLVGILAYLAHDDPGFRRQVPFEEAAQASAATRDSFNVLMRYGREHPLGKNFNEPTFKDPYPTWTFDDPARWRSVVTAHRAELDLHWLLLAPERAWWNELDRFDRIGDLTAPRPESEIIAFQVFRALTHQLTATASLQAIDGHGDEAIDTLLPLLRVAIKLQPESRILVRSMIAEVIERLSLKTAGFILDTTPVSPAARARLAAVLKGADPEAGARRLMEKDYVFSQNSLSTRPAGDLIHVTGSGKHGWLRSSLNLASPFIYNPKSTFNTYSRLSEDLQDIVGKRELGKMGPRMETFMQQEARPHFKNLAGLLLLRQMVPSLQKVAENYWLTEDLRAALLARVLAN